MMCAQGQEEVRKNARQILKTKAAGKNRQEHLAAWTGWEKKKRKITIIGKFFWTSFPKPPESLQWRWEGAVWLEHGGCANEKEEESLWRTMCEHIWKWGSD